MEWNDSSDGKSEGCTHAVDCGIALWALTELELSWDEDDHRFAHFLAHNESFFLLSFARFSVSLAFMLIPLFSPFPVYSTFDSFFC